MNRKKFIEKMGIAGLGGVLMPGFFTACSDDFTPANIDVNFNGKVIIVGAGAAGLMAGYVLQRYGIEFEIIEASAVHGGRVKEDRSLADFPIDLGAEWIHTDPKVLADMLADPTLNANIDIINYSPPKISAWKNGKLRQRNHFSNFYGEFKFKSSTWYSYFENFVVPTISANIRYNDPVIGIDYSTSDISVTTSSNRYNADRVIVTVPLSILKEGDITFSPQLPQTKTDALAEVEMPDGIKVFIEFTDNFYPDIILNGGAFEQGEADGEKIYYNAAYGKSSAKNILALFCVGDPATVYVNQPNDDALINFILDELDQYFEGTARPKYLRHVTQNWSAEPFIRGSYTHGNDNVLDTLKEPIDGKVFFAGETMAPSDTATVHGAANSAWVAAESILTNRN